MGELKAGVAEVNITPPIGISLCGFGNRKGPAEAVDDDLFARALVLDDGRTRLAIVTSDLISLAPDLVHRIRGLVERAADVPGDGLLLNGSHSHSGPTVMSFRSMGSRDVAYEGRALPAGRRRRPDGGGPAGAGFAPGRPGSRQDRPKPSRPP